MLVTYFAAILFDALSIPYIFCSTDSHYTPLYLGMLPPLFLLFALFTYFI